MSRPPVLPRILLRILVPQRLAKRIVVDLDEEWGDHILEDRGPLRSTLWYWSMTLRSVAAVWRDALAGPETEPGGGAADHASPGQAEPASGLEACTEAAREVRYAARSLLRSPGLSLSAISVMALGIAAAAVVFSVLDEVLIRPFEYDNPQEIVAIVGARETDPDDFGNVSYPNVSDIAARAHTLDGAVAASWWNPAFTEPGNTQVVSGLTVSWNYFSLLGVEPAAGRFFQTDEEGDGRPRVAVIGYPVWQQRYGGDPSIGERTVLINNVPYRIVGVAPEGFEDPVAQGEGIQVEAWRTPWFEAADWFRSGRSWKAVGRVAPGQPITAVNEELKALMSGLASEWPDENSDRTMRAIPIREWVTGQASRTIIVLMISVGLILLIACANIANLLLARGVRRKNELAVRAALGASEARLLRATLTEAVLLSLVGGGLGILLAYGGLDLVAALASSSIPRMADVAIDARVLGFSFSTALLTGLLFGAVPGIRSRRALGGSRTHSETKGDSRLRKTLVVVEVALTVVLLFGAGLFIRTFDALYRVELGLRTDGVASVALHDAGWSDLEGESGAAQWDDILDRLAAVPRVRAVGAIDIVPLVDSYSCDGTSRTDLPSPSPGEGQCTEVRVVLPGAFEALGIDVVTGRAPHRLDRDASTRVVWISEAARQMLWRDGENPLGRGLQIHGEEFTVAGVVTDIRHFGPQEPPRPMAYLTAHQEPWNGISRGLSVVIRSEGPIESVLPEIRSALTLGGAAIPFEAVRTMDELLNASVTAPRFRVALAGGFALIAFLISMVGLAGVISFSVSRRKREIGIRLALGARRGAIRAMVVGEGLTLLWKGLVLGMLVAIPAGLGLSKFLYAVQPWDPSSVLAVVVVMLGGVVLASLPPAIRAASSSPQAALQPD